MWWSVTRPWPDLLYVAEAHALTSHQSVRHKIAGKRGKHLFFCRVRLHRHWTCLLLHTALNTTVTIQQHLRLLLSSSACLPVGASIFRCALRCRPQTDSQIALPILGAFLIFRLVSRGVGVACEPISSSFPSTDPNLDRAACSHEATTPQTKIQRYPQPAANKCGRSGY